MEKSSAEMVKNEKVKPEKELCDGEDDGLSQLGDEESLGTIGEDMEDVHDEAVRETLAKFQVEGVRENAPVEPSDRDVGEVKETSPALTALSDPSVVEPSLPSNPSAAQGISLQEQKSDSQVVNNSLVSPVLKIDSGKEDVVSGVVPVDEVPVENREVETPLTLTPSSDPSMVKPSLTSVPSSAESQGLPLLEQKSDSGVVNNLSVSPGPRTDSYTEEVVSAVDEVAVENREVETPHALTPSSDPSMVKPSLSSVPSSAQSQGLPLLEQKSDSGVFNNLSASPGPKTDIYTEEVVSAVDEVAVENHEVQASPCLSKSPDPSIVEPSLPSDPSGQGLSLLQKSYDSKVVRNLSVSPVLRTPPRDGYNWRKYGQKQVKSPKGSRSYYRCTYSECCAKKIECSNDSGNMIEIVNKGLHSHEPPQKSSFSPSGIKAASAITPVSKGDTVVATVPSDSAPPPSTKENFCQLPTIVERKRHCENEAVEEPEPKRRLKKDNTQSSDYVSKIGKKHKHVIHAADGVEISGDGYRWRKYGQKMVKGNPNPRNYYRCTSAGCPVRKHIETAVQNTRSVVITYKGEHNHDRPVPKRRHDTPSSAVLSPESMRTRPVPKSRHDTLSSAVLSPESMRTRLDDQVTIPSSSSQCSVGRESEKQSSEALDVVGG